MPLPSAPTIDMPDWLNRAIGQRLLSVSASLFIFKGEVDREHPIRVRLVFSSIASPLLRCASDGFSLWALDEELEEFDMGEAGKVDIEDISQSAIWKATIGRELMAASVFFEETQGKPFGLHLDFGGAAAGVWNIGDDIWVLDALPGEMLSDMPHHVVQLR